MGNKAQLIKIIFISVFTIVTIGVEFAYRRPLFDHSVAIAKSVQKTFGFSIGFFEVYTWIGVIDYYFYIPLVLLLCPISYSYTFFIACVLATHFCNYTKMIYGEGRPYLKNEAYSSKGDNEILIGGPEKGYGNPSGHSFQCTIIFLGLSQMLIDYFKLNKVKSSILYIISAIIIVLVNFSRVLLGVHSVNQVIFGDCLGFILFFIIYIIFQPHLKEPKQFYEIFLKAKFHIINTICLVISFIYLVVGTVICEQQREKDPYYEELKKRLKELPKYNELKILTPNSVSKCLNIMAYAGANLGMLILAYFTRKRLDSKYVELNDYNRNTEKPYLICLLIRILCLGISYLPFLVVKLSPGISNAYIYYIFFNAIPMFFLGFLIFGPNIILILILKFANKDINILDKFSDGEYHLGYDDDDDEKGDQILK
jgi:membrane-associated phospholipid phosphatase